MHCTKDIRNSNAPFPLCWVSNSSFIQDTSEGSLVFTEWFAICNAIGLCSSNPIPKNKNPTALKYMLYLIAFHRYGVYNINSVIYFGKVKVAKNYIYCIHSTKASFNDEEGLDRSKRVLVSIQCTLSLRDME